MQYLLVLLIIFVPSSVFAAPLPDDLRSKVKFRGEISAKAEWCGLDWNNRSFKPFMAELRDDGISEEQMTFVGTYHGFYMQRETERLKDFDRPCNDADLEKISGYLY